MEPFNEELQKSNNLTLLKLKMFEIFYSLTHLRVSIDFHLLSKVNFNRVGPELGPLLWRNKR